MILLLCFGYFFVGAFIAVQMTLLVLAIKRLVNRRKRMLYLLAKLPPWVAIDDFDPDLPPPHVREHPCTTAATDRATSAG